MHGALWFLHADHHKQPKGFFQKNDIDELYIAAAKVGGIVGNNTFPAEFIYENLMIEANIIHAAHRAGVQKLLGILARS